jgi:manganese transport protein
VACTPSQPALGHRGLIALEDAPTTVSGLVRHLGPGFIITATIVGSGELIVTPKLGAAVGFTLLWFIVLGCAVKVFVQIELARFAIASGQTTLEALNSLPGPRWRVSWIVWLWLFMYLTTILQVGGIVGGIASVFAEGGLPGGARFWALPVGVSCALLLASGRYSTVERSATVMVTLFTVSTVMSVVALAWTPYHLTVQQVTSGLTFSLPADASVAFAAFGVIGVGASELIYYPYWCLEKGYARHIGPPSDTTAWVTRARGWMRVMRVDAWLSLVLYTSITAAFYLLGAAILNAQGLDVTNADLIPVLSQMYRQTFGDWTTAIFLTGAFFVLYSTFFVATASNARLAADAVALFGLRAYRSESDRRDVIRMAAVTLSLLCTAAYLFWSQPVTLVLVGATGQALMLPFLGIAALYFHYSRTRRVFGGGAIAVTCLWISALAMISLGLYQAWQTLIG